MDNSSDIIKMEIMELFWIWAIRMQKRETNYPYLLQIRNISILTMSKILINYEKKYFRIFFFSFLFQNAQFRMLSSNLCPFPLLVYSVIINSSQSFIIFLHYDWHPQFSEISTNLWIHSTLRLLQRKFGSTFECH